MIIIIKSFTHCFAYVPESQVEKEVTLAEIHNF